MQTPTPHSSKLDVPASNAESQRKSAPKTTLKERLRAAVSGVAIATNTIVLSPPMLALGMVNSLKKQQRLNDYAIQISNQWIKHNNFFLNHIVPHIDWQIHFPNDLDPQGQYMVISNHQSWVDTTVTQYVGLNRIPLMRFFTKAELIYIPFLGPVFKILGFPMMKRHSKAQIAKNPALRQQDLETARIACQNMLSMPFSLLNYVEGTRFTPAKQAMQQSPFKHLLKPKTAGLALALNILGPHLNALLDMTIVYPDGIPSYGDLWMGRVKRIVVEVEKIPLPDWILVGDYENDAQYRAQLQQWLNDLWHAKDARIDHIIERYQTETSEPA